MSTVNRSSARAFFLLLLAIGPVAAAPTDEATADGQAGVVRDARGSVPLERLTPSEVNTGSRTVDLLIELQGKQAGLGITATERAAPRADVSGTKADAIARLGAAPAPSIHDPGLLGSSVAPVASPSDVTPARPRDPDWRDGAAHSSDSSATPGPNFAQQAPAAAGKAYDDGHTSRLRAAVAWLRENRDWVIGVSVLLLVTVGLTSRRKAQRQR
jgi:hypothetical protein